MKHWFRDQHFRSLLKNTSYLALSRVVAALAGIITLAAAGRSLGVLMFGLLILIHSYAQAVSALTRFQSWQLIVRFGGPALASGDPRDFKSSVGFAFALDFASGIFGMIIGMALLPVVGNWVGIPDEYTRIAILYCTVVPTMAAATPSGVLRVLDRFDLISWQGSCYPIVRAILAVIAWFLDAPFWSFIAIWYVTDLGGDLYLWALAVRELKRRELLNGIRPSLRPNGLNGAWRFAIHVNLTSSLLSAWGPMARLAVGGLLGPAAAAMYRVAASLADGAQKPTDLLGRAFYPQIVRMDLRTREPWKLMLRGSVLASSVALLAIAILVVGGEPLIRLIFGDTFVDAYPVLMVLILAPLLGMLGFPLIPMLYGLDRPDAPLYARLLGTFVYAIIVAPLAWRFGTVGAAAAFVIGFGTTIAALMLQLAREYRRLRPT